MTPCAARTSSLPRQGDSKLDVVCVGGLAVDRVYRLSHLPQPGSGAHIVESARTGGGVEANVAVALARLGLSVGLIARAGEDADGRWLRSDLQAEGVDVTHVTVAPGLSSDFCQVWVGADGERMLACDNPCLRQMQLGEGDRAFVSGAGVLFLSGFVPVPLIRETISIARTAGLSVAFDLPDSFQDLAARGLRQADFWQLVPQVDLLMTNAPGLTSLVEIGRPRRAFATFCSRVPRVRVAMSMGAEGAWLGQGEQQVHVQAFPVRVIDTTGAGDAFHAALIYGLLFEGWSLRRAGHFASGLAALNCGRLGARGGLVSREAVIEFLSDQGARW